MVATLFIAAAANADARFAWPYPQKAESPDQIGHWVVINGNAWSHDVEPDRTGEKSSLNKEKMPHNAERSPWCRAQESRKSFHVL